MTEKKINWVPLFFAGIMLLITSCNQNIVYSEFTRIPEETWNLFNEVTFNPVITDTTSVNDIFITLRTNPDYPFQNIWFFISATSPSGKTVTDTLEYMLTDVRGKPLGKGIGYIKETDLTFRKGVFFPEKGTYIFRIRHGMRMENLKGINDIGLRIEKKKTKVK